ncbi:MAG: hypothetical protein ABIR56_13770, partial [Polaromonas sp.]
SITFGLLLGSVIAIRPDHVWLITAVRSALKQKQWAVVVHPLDAGQASTAKDIHLESGAQIRNTI